MNKSLAILLLFFIPFVQSSAQSKKDFEVTVLQWNVWQEGTVISGGYDVIVAEIARLQPDFVTLSEVRNYNQSNFTERLTKSLQKKGLTYYSFYSDDSGLISKHPIKDSVVVFPVNKDHGSIHKLVAEINGCEFAIYTGHLDYLDCAYYNVRGYDGYTWKETSPPTSVSELLRLNDLSWRDDQIRVFLNEARHDIEAGRYVIFGGDFNEPSHLDWTEATAQLYDHKGMIVPWTISKLLEQAEYKDGYRELYPNPLTHPGFTYPCYNADTDIKKLTWAPKADERERIDLIYYKGKGIKVLEAKLFGTDSSVCRSKPIKDDFQDTIIKPLGIYPSDHKGVWMKFKITPSKKSKR
ncbi:endonuclease [Capnocytophaga cynodegmi]|uniref:Endonuclease n=1 Tax=Capnocytophaga cynodegmi TaxID=28189 RepID=A0A286NT67_9FLAO|nr:endonuclease/exonuclease/phosphatase family protein [Capnocytophaga cynodegmi]ATA67150.1 endonuclease [Capnocytophaga cynodegmi]